MLSFKALEELGPIGKAGVICAVIGGVVTAVGGACTAISKLEIKANVEITDSNAAIEIETTNE